MHKKFAPKVFQLGYVALATPDLAKTKDHYLETIGLSETDGTREEVYLSVGFEHHNIVLRRAIKNHFCTLVSNLSQTSISEILPRKLSAMACALN